MQDRHLTLYIPGLLGGAEPWREALVFQNLTVAELELMLSRASRRPRPAAGFEAGLFHLFGLDNSAHDLPVAAVTHLIDRGEAVPGYCLRADPVHLLPDRDKVVMFGNRQLDVSVAEAQQLADEFNRLFAGDGLRLDVPVVDRWYLKLDRGAAISTHPLNEVIGKDIHPHLPKGSEAMQWHRFLNEVQMLFHSSSVNENRRRRGQAEINSIWLWGGGAQPALAPHAWSQVWSNEVLGRGLAALGGRAAATLPGGADEWLEQADTAGQHLAVIDLLGEAVQQGDVARWRDAVEGVNETWLVALTAALRANTLSSVRLLTDNAEFTITAKALKRWWKRRRPLPALQ